jgi:hypothetical protein
MGVDFRNSTIVDGGSSYGDLNLRFLQSLQRAYPNEKIKGIGIEYEKIRHVLGCQLLARMMKDASEADYNPLLNYDLQLIMRDMLTQNNFDIGTFLFLFDKVFPCSLCIQILASAINTPTLQYFMSCRQSHKTWYQGANFDYGGMIESTKAFQRIGRVKKLKMNGGEAAGTFHVYKRNKTVSSKDALKRLFQYCRDKFPKEQVDQKDQKEQKVKRKGKVKLENAEEKLFKSATNERLGRCDMPFPTLDPSPTQWRENAKHLHKYYAYVGDLEQLTRADRSIGKKDFVICYDTNDSKCHALDKCLNCQKRFPADKIAKRKCKQKDHDIIELGEGLCASTIISEGEMICQYQGKVMRSKRKGMYVAELTRDIYLDAKNVECLGRYANHSCAPNAQLVKVLVYPHVPEIGQASPKKPKKQVETHELWIVAIREIKDNEWITVSYGTGYQDFFVGEICLCEVCSSHDTNKRKKPLPQRITIKPRRGSRQGDSNIIEQDPGQIKIRQRKR